MPAILPDSSSKHDEHDFAGVVAPYLETMIPRGQKNVLSSRAVGEGDEDVAKSWQRMFQRSQKQ